MYLCKKKIKIIIIKQNTKTEIEECGLNAVCNPPTTAEAALLLPLDFSSTESRGGGGGGRKKNMTEKTGEKKSKSEKLFLLTQTSLFAASSTTGAQPARHRMPLEMRAAVLVSPTLHINQHLIKGK